jgi:CDP-diacylglycerol--glycerol-3-phosphate 3-phosphatidyltransferase
MNKKVIKGFLILFVNLITSIRLIGAFTLPFIYHYKGASVVAIYILVLFLSDAIDGFLARLFKVSTFFGSLIDASSDKILNMISFVILGLEYNIMFAPLIIEISILYTSYSTYRYGGNVSTSIIGKIKTIILDIFVIISFILISLNKINHKTKFIYSLINNTSLIINVFAIVIVLLCIFTLYDYMIKNKKARSNPKCMEIKYEEKNRKNIKTILSNLFDTDYYRKHKTESIMKQLYLE